MSTPKIYYFYLWRHRFVDDATDQIVARTCFGITSNPDNRIHGYEGHVGHVVKFVKLWTGPERLIRELETRMLEFVMQGPHMGWFRNNVMLFTR